MLRMAEVGCTLSLLYWGQLLTETGKSWKSTEVGGSQARPHSQAGSVSLDWRRPSGQAGILVRGMRSSAAGILLLVSRALTDASLLPGGQVLQLSRQKQGEFLPPHFKNQFHV